MECWSSPSATLTANPSSGVIRVVGDVNATGFGSTNAIEFYATRFELDAATGSVSIFSSGSTLGGELGLYADRIHVAEGSILDQLAANPTYSGYQEDLNAPAAVQRPEGVLRAATLWIESDNLQDILIQNTGTAATPAGFLFNESFINDDDEVAGPPGSIDLVVNGQVRDRRRDADRHRGARRAGRGRESYSVHRQQHDQRLPADRRVRRAAAAAAAAATADQRRRPDRPDQAIRSATAIRQ